MKRLFPLFCLLFLVFACSSPQKETGGDDAAEVMVADSNENAPDSEPDAKKKRSPGTDSYRLVIRYIDNRAIVYINDSTIYDSQTVYGEVDAEIDLTDYVNAGKTDLKVELYNGKPPYNTASPAWKLVYDIFINDELVEFVREDSRNGDIGLVHTESHDLSDIW